MIRKINHIASIFFNLAKKPFFGFIHGHRYLSSENLKLIESKIGLESEDVIYDFESQLEKENLFRMQQLEWVFMS